MALDNSGIDFDMEIHATQLGPFILANHRWLCPNSRVTYRSTRTERKIRHDQIDHYYLSLQLTGSVAGEFGRTKVHTNAGEFHLFDMSQPLDCVVTAGDAIALIIPRELFRTLDLGRHELAIEPAVSSLLADFLLSLCNNIRRLEFAAVPYVARATNSLLRAGLQGLNGIVWSGNPEVDVTLIQRAKQFIDANLGRADLSALKISEALGISRAKLYLLFKRNGGIMHHIQRQRLERAYDELTDPDVARSRIIDIAHRHGFSDEKYFSRIFRTHFGCLPREAAEFSRARPERSSMTLVRDSMGGPTFTQWLKTLNTGTL
jgi:AraC-like DNA-binding protein